MAFEIQSPQIMALQTYDHTAAPCLATSVLGPQGCEFLPLQTLMTMSLQTYDHNGVALLPTNLQTQDSCTNITCTPSTTTLHGITIRYIPTTTKLRTSFLPPLSLLKRSPGSIFSFLIVIQIESIQVITEKTLVPKNH